MLRYITIAVLLCSMITCDEVSDLKNKIGDSLKSKLNSAQYDKVKQEPVSKLGLLNSFLDAFNEVKAAFKTTFNTTIVKQFQNRGFENLDINTNIIEKTQYDQESLANFMELLLTVANIPENQQDEFLFTVTDYSSTETVWTGHEMFFKTGESNNKLNFIQVFINQDLEKKNTLNILVIDVTGKFELADDIIIKQKSSSFVGGIFNKEEIICQKKPAYLSNEDLKGLLTFFKYIATNAYLSENGLSQSV